MVHSRQSSTKPDEKTYPLPHHRLLRRLRHLFDGHSHIHSNSRGTHHHSHRHRHHHRHHSRHHPHHHPRASRHSPACGCVESAGVAAAATRATQSEDRRETNAIALREIGSMGAQNQQIKSTGEKSIQTPN